MAKVQNGPEAGFLALVATDDVGLQRAARRDDPCQGLGVAVENGLGLLLKVLKESCVENDAILDHFRQSAPQLAVGK